MFTLLVVLAFAQEEMDVNGFIEITELSSITEECPDVVVADILRADRTGTLDFRVIQTIRGELSGVVSAYADPSISLLDTSTPRVVFLCEHSVEQRMVRAIAEPAVGQSLTGWIRIRGLPLGSHVVSPGVVPMSQLDERLSGETPDLQFQGELVGRSADDGTLTPLGLTIGIIPNGVWTQAVLTGIDPGGMMLQNATIGGEWPDVVSISLHPFPHEQPGLVGRFTESGLQFSLRDGSAQAHDLDYPASVVDVEETRARVATVSATAAMLPMVIDWNEGEDWTCTRTSPQAGCLWQTPEGALRETHLTMLADGWHAQIGQSTLHIFGSRSTVTGRSPIDELARQSSAGMHTVEVITGPNTGRVGRIGRAEHLRIERGRTEAIRAHLSGAP